jgi:hypothetical protein
LAGSRIEVNAVSFFEMVNPLRAARNIIYARNTKAYFT